MEDLPLREQEELLAHLGRCTGFLYFIGSLREEVQSASEVLRRMTNSREQDIASKATMAALEYVENKFYEGVSAVQEHLAAIEEAEENMEEEL
ncbi:MAG TPA: hypothetical protein VNA25_19525 [Phycisphaerae bacterium]|nr:hypothetical protein [Phycisphaerae bacterium]